MYHTEAPGAEVSQTILTDTLFNPRGGVEAATAPYFAGDTPVGTATEYDGWSRPTRITLPDGNTVETSYGLLSQTLTDERGKTTTTRTDVFGRPVSTERALNGQVVTTRTSTHDALGRVIGMADALGNTWGWSFDSLGRTVQSDDPDAGITTFEYDDAGRLTATVDAKGQRTELEYDLAGRETKKTVYPSGGGASVTETVYGEARSGYYNAGRPTSLVDADGPMEINYDAAGNVVHQTRTIDGVQYVLENRFDNLGLQRGITYPDGDAVGTPADPWGYTRTGRLASIPGFFTEIDYDARGRATRLANANGTVTTKTYALDRGFLERILTTGPGGVIQDMSYTHDPSGLVTLTASPFANEDWSYSYDDLDRLTLADNLSNNAADQSFAYDAIGRITFNSKVGSYTYPAVGAPRPHAPTQAGGASYSYDPNGNMTAGAGRTYVWDGENRIQSVTVGGQTASFTYGPIGERLKKEAAGVASVYPYGDFYEVTNGTVTKYLAVKGFGLFAKKVGSDTYWLHTDRQKSVQAVTDATGAEVFRRTYTPYGETLSEGSGHTESRGWIGERHDTETGLTFLHARYYDPQVGTFVSPDPIGVKGGMNLYGYAAGNPVNLSDPSGLIPSTVVFPGECPFGVGQFCPPDVGPNGPGPAAVIARIAARVFARVIPRMQESGRMDEEGNVLPGRLKPQIDIVDVGAPVTIVDENGNQIELSAEEAEERYRTTIQEAYTRSRELLQNRSCYGALGFDDRNAALLLLSSIKFEVAPLRGGRSGASAWNMSGPFSKVVRINSQVYEFTRAGRVEVDPDFQTSR